MRESWEWFRGMTMTESLDERERGIQERKRRETEQWRGYVWIKATVKGKLEDRKVKKKKKKKRNCLREKGGKDVKRQNEGEKIEQEVGNSGNRLKDSVFLLSHLSPVLRGPSAVGRRVPASTPWPTPARQTAIIISLPPQALQDGGPKTQRNGLRGLTQRDRDRQY